MDISLILEKATKLKNLSERAGTPEEAAVAATKLQELVLRYNIDMQTISTEEDEYLQDEFQLPANRNQKIWQANLYHNIAQAFQCEALLDYYVKGRPTLMFIVGRKHNIQVVNYLFTYLSNTIVQLSKQHGALVVKRKAVFQRGFCMGAERIVSQRIRKMFEMIRKESTTNTEVMVVEQQRVKAKFDKIFPKKYKGGKTTVGSYDGFAEGQKAGKDIPIRQAVNSSPQQQLT